MSKHFHGVVLTTQLDCLNTPVASFLASNRVIGHGIFIAYSLFMLNGISEDAAILGISMRRFKNDLLRLAESRLYYELVNGILFWKRLYALYDLPKMFWQIRNDMYLCVSGRIAQ